jgi:hypothetical protein
MFARALGTILLGVALLAGANALNAQTAPTLDSCRDEAVRRGISGDGLSAFLTTCMSQPAPGASSQRASFDRCRSDAVSRNLVGDARMMFIDDCMVRSGAAEPASTDGTYGQCRSQARARGLSGTQLDEFLTQCVVR